MYKVWLVLASPSLYSRYCDLLSHSSRIACRLKRFTVYKTSVKCLGGFKVTIVLMVLYVLVHVSVSSRQSSVALSDFHDCKQQKELPRTDR